MISPELLRRFPFFAPFSSQQLAEFAMISDEYSTDEAEVLFEECQPATHLFLLLEGNVDLYYKTEDPFRPKGSKEFSVGIINPGEVFSVSSLIDPYVLNATAKASEPSKYVKMDAVSLRKMMEEDHQLGFLLMQQVTKVLMERLAYTRVQLAAAWA